MVLLLSFSPAFVFLDPKTRGFGETICKVVILYTHI